MCRIKIPPQDFAIKMQGGLMHKRERICGTLWYYHQKLMSRCHHNHLQNRKHFRKKGVLVYISFNLTCIQGDSLLLSVNTIAQSFI